jgi:hypothetical protein
MSGRFDNLSRAMAGPMPRRGVLKLLGAAAAAGVGAVVLKPFRADATCNAGETPCGANCCAAGVACLDPSTGRCGCPAGATQCGSNCCSGTCSFTNGAGNGCCCDAGLTPCGTACCAKGIACADRSSAVCGCPAGYTSCGSGLSLSCCPSGAPCGSGTCKSARNGTLGNYIFCEGGPCRPRGATCFSNKQCCPGFFCSCSNEGFSVCC